MFKTWTALWPKAGFEVNMLKTFHARSTFGSWAVQQAPMAVARRTFEVKMRQKRSFATATQPSRFAHFWQGAESIASATRHDAQTWKSRAKRSFWLKHFIAFWLSMSFAPQPRGTFWTAQLPTVLRAWKVFNMLTSKSALGHNAVHVLNILTSTHAPKISEACICAFWLPNVLRATTGCTFSISHLQQVLWDRGALNILTFKSASRHSRVQFFVPPFSPSVSAPAALASLLLDPPGPQNIGKTACFELSYLFAHLDLLSTDSFSPLTTPAHKLEAWLLYFLRLYNK